MQWKTMALLGLIVVGVVLSACGSESNSSRSSGPSKSATTSGGEAAKTLAPQPPTEPPAQIRVTTPVSKRPPTGKTFAYAACELHACQQYVSGMKEATSALGWRFLTYTYKSGQPDSAVQKAVDAGANYIAINGSPSALYKNALANANKKGIKVISAVDVTPPDPSQGLIAELSGISGYGSHVVAMARWALNRTGPDTNLAFLNVPDFPILSAGYKMLKDDMATHCAQCPVAEIPLSLGDLGAGKTASTVVAYLQSHPKVNNVVFSFADPLPGVHQALKAAGFADKVAVTGISEQPVPVNAVLTGESPGWLMDAQKSFGWVEVDAAVRDSVGDPQLPTSQSNSQEWILNTKEQAQMMKDNKYTWDGPVGYQDQFKKVWKLT